MWVGTTVLRMLPVKTLPVVSSASATQAILETASLAKILMNVLQMLAGLTRSARIASVLLVGV